MAQCIGGSLGLDVVQDGVETLQCKRNRSGFRVVAEHGADGSEGILGDGEQILDVIVEEVARRDVHRRELRMHWLFAEPDAVLVVESANLLNSPITLARTGV